MKIQNERSSSVESLDRIHTFSLKNGTSKVSEKKAEIKIVDYSIKSQSQLAYN
jgi:hypothetical protein